MMPENAAPQPPLLTPPDPGYPPRRFDFIFADGVTGVSPGSDIIKFTLSVSEPNHRGDQPNKAVPVAQIVMPIT
jgi:hypothetical protein